MKTTNLTLALALGLLGACLARSTHAQIVSDDFDKPALNTNLWTWLDPAGDSSYSISGYGGMDVVLVVTVPAGGNHDPWVPNNSVQLVQAAPNQDLELTAKFESIPALQNQEEGILVYDPTGTNFLRFNIQVQPTLVAFMLIINNGAGNTLAGGTWAIPSSSLAIPADGGNDGTAFLRVKRKGDTWTFLISPDGVVWETVYQPVQQAWTVAQVGLYVGDTGTGFTSAIDYFFNDASPIVFEDGQPVPPSVAITAPAAGAVITLPTNLVVTASATDANSNSIVTKVDFYDGTTLLGTATTSPYSITWTNPSLGLHNNLHAAAADSLGLTAPSPNITVQVVAPDAVAITAPADESVFTLPTNLVVAASATDVAGSITKVDFYAVDFYGGTTLLGTATTSPYSITWTNPSPGWHTLVSKATDTLGYIAPSSNVRFQIYTAAGAPVSEDFNHAALNTSLWTWVDPTGDDTYAISGYGTTDVVLSVTVSGNEQHDAWVPNTCPQLLQNAVDQDFEVTAKFETIPGANYGEYGFLVYDPTATNFLRFNVQGGGGSALDAYLLIIQNGNGNTLAGGTWGIPVGTLVSPTDGTDNGTAYMRLRRQDDTWTFLLSPDGFNWETVYQPVTQTWTVAQVGPFWGGNAAFPITFALDYFFNDASPILYEDGQPPLPTVSITAPAAGAVVALPTKLVLTASATDVAGSITKVDFYDGTNLLGTATTSPYNITWTNPSPGWHSSVHAVANNSLGLSAPSASITVVVTGAGSLPLSDDFNKPVINSFWTAVDPVGDGAFQTAGAGTGDAHLIISVPTANSHDGWTANDMLRLLQPVLDQDFEVEAKFDTLPPHGTGQSVFEGISVEDANGIALRFDAALDATWDSGTNLFAWYGINIGSSTAGGVVSLPMPDLPKQTSNVGTIYQRVRRIGQVWSGYTSKDGVVWTLRGQFSNPLVPAMVGIHAGDCCGGGSGTFTFSVDYFFNSLAPILLEDGQTAPTLAVTPLGSNVELSWSALQAAYGVEVTTNLTSPHWSAVTNGSFNAVGNENILTLPNPSHPSFYRLAKSVSP
jgi:hypothetical protein